MTQSKKVPEHKLRQRGNSANSEAASGTLVGVSSKDKWSPLAPWPFSIEDGTPLAWWRLLPPSLLRGSEQLVRNTLNDIAVLRGGDEFGAALRGDAAAAIGVALAAMPIDDVELRVDIAMTTLLSTALEPNASSALVMAQIIGLTVLDHPFGAALASSWLDFGRQHAADPQNFIEAEVVLKDAFRQRHNGARHPGGVDAGGRHSGNE
jgi:hypothetical protein